MTPKRKPKEAISRERLRALPACPGVYLMKGAYGEVLYVGKAKNLKARVRSYFSGGDGRETVQYLLEQVCAIDTLVTEDERQAIILEADLIKKYKPHYNVRLKDDKAYLLVRLDLAQEWPKLELRRAAKEDGAKYFGPFAFSYELRTLLEIIKRTVPLRTCSDNVLHNRVSNKALRRAVLSAGGSCAVSGLGRTGDEHAAGQYR